MSELKPNWFSMTKNHYVNLNEVVAFNLYDALRLDPYKYFIYLKLKDDELSVGYSTAQERNDIFKRLKVIIGIKD